ncbi:phosphoserine phosphatase SerB [Cognaticolwellia mytili]|uniref:phosphoserine phosphatase SerB n=1 Tax=Cognaticolwellia mytili TaxID=1888913 RepID=UPI001F1806B8|nr:phosphoserine phosphatase SerB [Cognaticolwellia mytili]
MTSPQEIIFLSDIKQQNISQWLSVESEPIGLLLNFNEQLQAFELLTTSDGSSSSSERVELVVFSDLNITAFVALLTKCEIGRIQLRAINHRNNATSYRFDVLLDDFQSAREHLAKLTSREKFEAALLLNAPSLQKPGLLVMDMDSTTIKIECIDEIAALAGVGEEVAAVTELAMQGKLDFSESLHQRVDKLAGAPEEILARVAKDIPLMEGLKNLVTELKKNQWRVAIASGGFTYFADHLKAMLLLDAAVANILEIKSDALTGNVLGEVIDAQAKADCLTRLQKEFNISSVQTVAMGDGANDLVMMKAAHLGVAFHAKPLVLAQADACIANAGLDCLLHWLA